MGTLIFETLYNANLDQKRAPLSILIVDDVSDNRTLLAIYLKDCLHHISIATNGLEALELARTQHFDVIFMDIQMPKMDGLEATQLIRQLEGIENRTKPARIYACTTNSFHTDTEKSLRAGCDLHLSKPIRKDLIINILQLPAEIPKLRTLELVKGGGN